MSKKYFKYFIVIISKYPVAIAGIVMVLIPGILTYESTFAQNDLKRQFNRKAFEHFSLGLVYDIQGNTAEAIKEMIRAAQLDTANPVILKALGDLYVFKVRNYTMGAGVLEEYLQLNPYDDRTIEVISKIYMQNSPQRYDRLENVLSTVINSGNDQPKYYSTLVNVLLAQKKIDFAQNMSLMYIKRTGESQESYEEVAEMFISNSMVVEGIDFFSDYLMKNPGSPNIGIVVGVLNQAVNNESAAERAFLDVIRKNETAYRARLRLSEMYARADKIDNALQLYDILAFHDPMEIPVKMSISEQLLQNASKQNYAKIESIMKSIVDIAGSNAQIHYYLGRAQSGLSKHDESVQSYRKSLREDPLNEVVLFYLTQAEMELENFADASSAISKAIELRPDEKAFYVIQGLIFDRMGDYNSAIATYEAGIAVNSQNDGAQATLLNNYSYMLSEHDRDLDKALEMAKMAIRVEPENSSFLDTLGWVHYKLGDFEKALEFIQKSVDNNSESAEVLDHLGDVFHKLGDTIRAKEYWGKALDLDSGNSEIRNKIENTQD